PDLDRFLIVVGRLAFLGGCGFRSCGGVIFGCTHLDVKQEDATESDLARRAHLLAVGIYSHHLNTGRGRTSPGPSPRSPDLKTWGRRASLAGRGLLSIFPMHEPTQHQLHSG